MKIRIFLFGLLVTAGFGALAQNVGIGVSNPRTRLDIDGDIRIGRHNTDTMAGRIKYNPASKIFEGYDSTTWIPLQSRWSAGTGTNIYRPLGNVGIEWDNPTGKLGIIADATTDNIVLQKSAPGVFLRVYNTADISWPFQMSMGTNAFGDSYASLRISTGWPNQMTIHKSGRIGFGTDVPGTAQGMESCLIEFADDDPLHSDWGMRLATDMPNGYPAVIFAKSAGTIDAPAPVSDGHMCGGFLFTGYNGSKYTRLGEIRGEVDGNVSGGGAEDMPGRIVFWTKLDGTAGDGVERMRITNRGWVGIGTVINASSAPRGFFDVQGGSATSGSGASIYLNAQNGYTSGNTNGGSIYLMTGSSNGTGTIGNIGIGTATPMGYLDIRPANPVPPTNAGQSGKNILIYAQNAAVTGSATGNFNGGNIILFPGSAMSNGTDGYVGISTTTPSEMLDVNGRLALQPTTAPATTTNKLYNVGGTLYWNGSTLGGGGGISGSGTSDYLPRWTSSTTLGNSLIRDNATRVAIGTNPSATSSLFHVEGNISGSGNGAAEFINTNGSRRAVIADPDVAGYFDAGGSSNLYALQLNGDFYNQETSSSSATGTTTFSGYSYTAVATATITYRAGSSIIINAFYSCGFGSNNQRLAIRLVRSGAASPLIYSGNMSSATSPRITSTSLVYRDTGLTDGTTYTYTLEVNTSATPSAGTINYSLVPMMIKD